jgi:hypothetical protein
LPKLLNYQTELDNRIKHTRKGRDEINKHQPEEERTQHPATLALGGVDNELLGQLSHVCTVGKKHIIQMLGHKHQTIIRRKENNKGKCKNTRTQPKSLMVPYKCIHFIPVRKITLY